MIMSGMWNEAELKRPPLITVEIPNASFVKNAHCLLTTFLQSDHGESKQFAHTAALLSRLIARRKNSFRRMIGFRALLMLNSSLARLLRVDIQRDLESFFEVLPDMVFGKKEIAALPTRNYLDFILLRLLTVYNIHQRIQICSGDAAEHFAELMRAHHFLDLNVILISVLAKLRSLNVVLGNRFVHVYNNLVRYREQFPFQNQKLTLTVGEDIPFQLKTFHTSQLKEEKSSDHEVKSTKIILAPKKNTRKCADIGTEIERNNKISKRGKQFQIEDLKTIDDIKRFIAFENKERVKCFEHCTTRLIENHLWAGAQKIFERKVKLGDEKKALNVFRRFLSSNM